MISHQLMYHVTRSSSHVNYNKFFRQSQNVKSFTMNAEKAWRLRIKVYKTMGIIGCYVARRD